VNRLAAAPAEHGLEVLAVVAGSGQSAAQTQAKYTLRFPVVAEHGSQAFESYRVRVTPFGFVIGEDGRIRAKGLCDSGLRLHDLLEAGGMEEAARVVGRGPDPVALGATAVEGGAS